MIPATCVLCTATFERFGSRARYCPTCRPIREAERQRLWTAANHERRLHHTRTYQKRHPEVGRAWRERNLEKSRDIIKRSAHRRLAAKRAVPIITFSAEQAAQRMAYFGNRCWMCGGPGPHMDHVKPLSRGGSHILANLRPACKPCNSRKGSRWPYPVAS